MTRFSFNINTYPLKVILSTCSWFLDRYFVFLNLKSDKLEITLKPKGREKTEELKENFLDRLEKARLYFALDKKNKNLRQYIVKQSLLSIGDIYGAPPDCLCTKREQ